MRATISHHLSTRGPALLTHSFLVSLVTYICLTVLESRWSGFVSETVPVTMLLHLTVALAVAMLLVGVPEATRSRAGSRTLATVAALIIIFWLVQRSLLIDRNVLVLSCTILLLATVGWAISRETADDES